MTLYEELIERGLIAQVTNEEEISKMINEGKATFYIGFDPTADSLHVGHFMALCLMNALFVLRPAKLWAFNIGHPCPSLAKGELNVIVLRPNFQQTSNRSRTIIKPRPFRYPTKIRNVIIGRNLLWLTAARSEQSVYISVRRQRN